MVRHKLVMDTMSQIPKLQSPNQEKISKRRFVTGLISFMVRSTKKMCSFRFQIIVILYLILILQLGKKLMVNFNIEEPQDSHLPPIQKAAIQQLTNYTIRASSLKEYWKLIWKTRLCNWEKRILMRMNMDPNIYLRIIWIRNGRSKLMTSGMVIKMLLMVSVPNLQLSTQETTQSRYQNQFSLTFIIKWTQMHTKYLLILKEESFFCRPEKVVKVWLRA